ncbi:hypothetical protein GCM10025867_22170 [Frondihabitans sucicola]|uniref:Ribose-5-phosphate isomerase n=1 Tax=Frondihabitans sucicola TaxID=1268041 RepID=A0ABN6XYG1_9MICO|nr:hypothetical protein GCM10025867_22170 [Frondihabitans sucicola]
MRIHVATDHAGLEFAQTLIKHLTDQGHDVTDHGPKTYEPLDDYPSFCISAARAVVRDQSAGLASLGVVFGGSGNGEQIAANKVEGVRAALAWNTSTAQLARQHNDANVVAIGARQHTEDEAISSSTNSSRRRSPSKSVTSAGSPSSPSTRRPARSRATRSTDA